MTHAFRIHETGGPEVLKWEEVELGAPGEGEVRVRQSAVGLNYIDVYHRTGMYPGPSQGPSSSNRIVSLPNVASARTCSYY